MNEFKIIDKITFRYRRSDFIENLILPKSFGAYGIESSIVFLSRIVDTMRDNIANTDMSLLFLTQVNDYVSLFISNEIRKEIDKDIIKSILEM